MTLPVSLTICTATSTPVRAVTKIGVNGSTSWLPGAGLTVTVAGPRGGSLAAGAASPGALVCGRCCAAQIAGDAATSINTARTITRTAMRHPPRLVSVAARHVLTSPRLPLRVLTKMSRSARRRASGGRFQGRGQVAKEEYRPHQPRSRAPGVALSRTVGH